VLTEEADIQATFEYIDAKKGLSENIFLYPWYFSFIRYQNGLLGEPPASVEHWRAFR
jgi:hypothetical protein